MAPHFTAVADYLSSRDELVALSHVNLQIDNGFFWRSGAGEAGGEVGGEAGGAEPSLECGLLDWYGANRTSSVSVWLGCLSGAEPEVLVAHEDGLMRAFSEELYRWGGPLIDPNELKLQYRLAFVAGMPTMFQYIRSDILSELPEPSDWAGIADRWDPRVMGRWDLRCRLTAIIQALGFYRAVPLHSTFMAWVASRAGPPAQ